MIDITPILPTLFRVVTDTDDLTYEDTSSSKMLYFINAEFRGQKITEQRVLKSFIKDMQDGSLRGDRHFGSFGFGHSLKWGRGINQIERDKLYDQNVNLVSMHPGLGPLCHSHSVRDNIHFINLVSMVTVIEHLLATLDTEHFRSGMINHGTRDWVDAYVDHSMHYVLNHLVSARYISPRGVINMYEYKRHDDGMSLDIGGLWVMIKIDEYLQVTTTYDQRTRAMVKDNYGDDFIYE